MWEHSGNPKRPQSEALRLRDKSFGIMATFNFSWLRGNKGKRGKLNISKRGTKEAMVKTKTSEGQGCGKSISWSTMKQAILKK